MNTRKETKEERISRLEKAGIIDPNCPGCQSVYESTDGIGEPGPGHQPSRLCKSGKRPHCTCDTCF